MCNVLDRWNPNPFHETRRKGKTRQIRIQLVQTVLAGALIWLSASCSGFAGEAAMVGWKKQVFDFGAPDLRGVLMLPDDSTMQTAQYQPRQAGTAGQSTIVAKIDASASVPADITIMAFDLEYPASPLRACAYEMQAIGLDPVSQSVTDDMSSATLRSVEVREGKFEQIGFTRCLTRGTKLLAFHFAVKPQSVDEDGAVELGETIETFAEEMFREMSFEDDMPVSHWRGMTDIELKLGEQTTTLKASAAWTVAINDFSGPLPAELHLVRKRDGKDAGLVWLGAFPASESFDISGDGERILRDFIAKQSPDFGEIKLVLDDRLTLPEGISGEQHRFRFEITSKSGGEAGDVLAMVTRSGDKLYTLAWWSSPISGDIARERFMARLPGLTAYDLVLAAMNRLIVAR